VRKHILFVSKNECKLKEAKVILDKLNIVVDPFKESIDEIQTLETDKLVKDKAIKAFKIVRQPLFVEHTGLYLEYLNEFPGGLTQIFWDSLKADKFAELFGKTENTRTFAKTIIAYIDGKKVHIFEGMIAGVIVRKPRGDREFQWDCVFQPDGYDQTFAEMGSKKNDISMRKKALDEFAKKLKEMETNEGSGGVS